MRAAALVALGALLISACVGLSSCASLTPTEQASVAADAVAISVCQAEAHDCHEEDGGASKCWGVYDDCMARHGLKDAGGQ